MTGEGCRVLLEAAASILGRVVVHLLQKDKKDPLADRLLHIYGELLVIADKSFTEDK